MVSIREWRSYQEKSERLKQMKKKTRVGNSDVLFGPPPILAGEESAFEELSRRVCEAIKPIDVIDEMLIADVVASEWEFLRWSRLKISLIQACAAKGLVELLNNNLDCDQYREHFVKGLAEILQYVLAKDQAEDHPQNLARACALNETVAVDTVKEMLSRIKVDISDIIDDARVNRAKELVKEYVRRESGAAALIDGLLAKEGKTIDALIFPHLEAELEHVERVDRLTTVAEARRNASLREIDRRRSVLGEKLRRSVQEIEERELTLIETTPRKGKDAA
jgi:hypothetical protein